jgi:hypothetical protein
MALAFDVRMAHHIESAPGLGWELDLDFIEAHGVALG